MSINSTDLSRLKTKFLYNSVYYLGLKKQRSKVIDRITSKIEKDSVKGYTPEQLQDYTKYVLNFYYITSVSLSWSKYFYYISGLKLPREYVIDNSKLSRKCRYLIKKLLEIDKCLKDIEKNFNRYVNSETSLTWLKANLPGVYRELKENGVSTFEG